MPIDHNSELFDRLEFQVESNIEEVLTNAEDLINSAVNKPKYPVDLSHLQPETSTITDMLEYQTAAIRTESQDFIKIQERFDNPQTIRLLHAAMGMATEGVELLDMVKKHLFYGKPLDHVNAVEEIGDCSWYMHIAADTLGISLLEIIVRNLAKLHKRYPDKFLETDALGRDTDAENQVFARGIDNTKVMTLEDRLQASVKRAQYRSRPVDIDKSIQDLRATNKPESIDADPDNIISKLYGELHEDNQGK